ncbi:MAG: hypothetical protein R3B11_08515 [Nitrospira sp.]|nr:hypothetical protein [Nitrospira sp.]
MDQQTLNRRSLCKVLVVLALAALTTPLKRVLAAPVAKPVLEDPFPPGIRQDKPRPFICILRRQSPGTCGTFLRENVNKPKNK